MQPANRHGELIARLPRHCALFGKFDVMGVRRSPSANKAGLRGDKPEMVAIALAYRLADGDDLSSRARAFPDLRLAAMSASGRRSSTQLVQPGHELTSTLWASTAESWFFSGKTRYAQVARASGSLVSASSEISRSRSFSEASGGRVGVFMPSARARLPSGSGGPWRVPAHLRGRLVALGTFKPAKARQHGKGPRFRGPLTLRAG